MSLERADFLSVFEQVFLDDRLKYPGRGGGLPYEEYTGVCHELGSYFQEKIPKRVCQFLKTFQKGL